MFISNKFQVPIKDRQKQTKIIPSLVIGCGGVGTAMAQQVKNYLLDIEFENDLTKLQHSNIPVKFISFDTEKQNIKIGSIQMEHNLEFLNISITKKMLNNIISNPQYPSNPTPKMVKAILENIDSYNDIESFIRDVTSSEGAGTAPPLGRLYILSNWFNILEKMKNYITNIYQNKNNFSKFDVENTQIINVYLLFSIFGGTGSGIVFDVAAIIRQAFLELAKQQPNIYCVGLMPEFRRNTSNWEIFFANFYTFLKEVNYIQSNPSNYLVRFTDETSFRLPNNTSLFNFLFLLNSENSFSNSLLEEEAITLQGELIYQWLFSDFNINNRLIDAPRNVTILAGDFLSSFGGASAFIPYDAIKNNLAIEVAIKIMEKLELTVLNDNITIKHIDDNVIEFSKYIDKIEKKINLNDYKKRLKITDNAMKDEIQFPPINELDEIGAYKDLNSFIEDFNEIISSLGSYVENIEKNPITSSNELKQFKHDTHRRLTEIKEELIKQGGFPLVYQVLYKKFYEELTEEINIDTGEKLKLIKNQIRNLKSDLDIIRETINKKTLFKKVSKKKVIAEIVERGIYDKIYNLKNSIYNYTTLAYKEQIIEAFEELKSEITAEYHRFLEIYKSLLKKKINIEAIDYFRFNPIPNEEIQKFIKRQLEQPSIIQLTEILSKNLRKDGLLIKQKKNDGCKKLENRSGNNYIAINDFDECIEIVIENLIYYVKSKLNRVIIDLNKSFLESGFFPLEGGETTFQKNAYNKTFLKLKKKSSPYLAHSNITQNKLMYSIIPNSNAINERETWRKLLLDENRQVNIFNGLHPHIMTLYQFEFGIGIPNLKNFHEYLESYKNYKGKRPLYRFSTIKDLDEIDIKIEMDITLQDFTELYHFAWNFGRGGDGNYSNCETIFFGEIDGKHYFNYELIDNNKKQHEVKKFYFNIFQEKSISFNDFKSFLKNDNDLFKIFKSLVGKIPNFSLKSYFTLKKMDEFFDCFLEDLSNDEILSQTISEVGLEVDLTEQRILIKREKVNKTSINLIEKYFYKEITPNPENNLKDLDPNKERESIYNNKKLLEIFLECLIKVIKNCEVPIVGLKEDLKEKLKQYIPVSIR